MNKSSLPLRKLYPLALSLSVLSVLTLNAPAIAEESLENMGSMVAQAINTPPSQIEEEEVVARYSSVDATSQTAAPSTNAPASRLADPNPATHSHFGWGRFRLPSVKLDVGANIPISQAMSQVQKVQQTVAPVAKNLTSGQLSETEAKAFETSLTDVLGTFTKGVRLDYDVDLSVVGFMGSPIGALKIADKNLTLGLNIGGGSRGYVAVNLTPEMSKGLKDLAGSTSDIIKLTSDVTSLSSSASGLTSSVTALTTLAGNAANIATNLTNPTQVVSELDNAIKAIDDLTQTSTGLVTSANSAISTGEKLTSTISTAAKGGLNIDAVVDGHLTFGISGSYPVYESENIRVAVGTNLKLFALPFNPTLQSFGLTGADTTLMGRYQLNQLAGIDTLSDSVQTSINGVKPVITSIEGLNTQAGSVKSDLTALRNQISAAGTDPLALVNLAADPTFTQNVSNIGTTVSTMTQSVASTSTDATAAFNEFAKLQTTFTQGLGSIQARGTVVDPSGAGFGVDLGVDAVIGQNVWLGLTLQNPLVLWPATEKPFTVGADGKISVDNVNKKSTNYTMSEPLGVVLAGRYSFDQLLPNFSGLSAFGEFEFINNGRDPGLTLGAQKQLGPAYVGLGGRIGGPSSVLFLQGGVRAAGPFGLSLTVGVSPSLSGGVANLGMFLQY